MRHRKPNSFTLLTLSALLACFGLACEGKRSVREFPLVEIDEARLTTEATRRVNQAADSQAVAARLDLFIDNIGAGPEVSKSGEALLGALGEAPALAPHFAKITDEFAASPKTRASMRRLRRDQPGLNDEQVGEAFVSLVNKNVEGKAFDKAFDTEIDKLFAAPEVERVFDKFGAQVGSSPHLRSAIVASLRHISDRDWGRRITKLNGGKVPNRERATDLLLDHVFTQKRCEAFYLEVFSLPAVERHSRRAAADLLSSPNFRSHVVTALESLFAEESFRKDAVSFLELLTEEDPTQERISLAVRKMTEHPLIQKTLAKLVDRIVTDPSLSAIGDAALKKISIDPATRQALREFVDRW